MKNNGLYGLVLALLTMSVQAEELFRLSEADWARPRTAAVVKSFTAVDQAVTEFLKAPAEQRLELRYPGGEAGSLWAGELKGWLIALGIPSDKLEIYPGHPVAGELALVVLP